jgi:hypothetical protein
MALDVFGKEIRPGDLILTSGAGNGYFDIKCVKRVMPKSIETTGYSRKINVDKVLVITEAQAFAYYGGRMASIIEESRKLKKELGIED